MSKKEITDEIRLLTKIANRRGFKPLWVVAEVVKRYGENYALSGRVVHALSQGTKIKRDKIKWFIKEVLHAPITYNVVKGRTEGYIASCKEYPEIIRTGKTAKGAKLNLYQAIQESVENIPRRSTPGLT